MKIYTRKGDGGETGLVGGDRVPKDHLRVAAYGGVDELNAELGMARSLAPPEDIDVCLHGIQQDLFVLGSELATPDPTFEIPRLAEGRAAELEAWIDAAEAELPSLKHFILPGGSPLAASLHRARTVCRRAERAVVTLMRDVTVPDRIPVYLNRLSDLLFVAARLANHRAGAEDEIWRGKGG
jgi:cob(I)alamin adenosyltransferase